MQLSHEWREINNGRLAGMLNSDALKLYPHLFFNTLGMDEPYPDGESPREFYTRIKTAFNQLCEEMKSKKSNILLMTHSGVIHIIYNLINNMNWTNQSKALFQMSNTGIHILEYESDRWTIIQSNNIEHLNH
jgi:broad specificity phosphatase PhoE